MSASRPSMAESPSHPDIDPGCTAALPLASLAQFASGSHAMDLSCAGVIYLDSAMDAIGVDNDGASRLLVSGSRPSLDVIMTFGPCDDDRTLDNRETAVMSTSARTDSSPLYHSSLMSDRFEST
ncbi:hypothetical protein B0H13DRAFT_2376595 [Mycena leptocephala]|nr:hypothetical protein B0H13DRAFT_2376595 [Mycena leptocephala]